MSLSLGILFGLVTMITFGIGNTYLKKLTDKVGAFNSVIYRAFFSFLFLLIITLILIKTILIPKEAIFIMLILGFFGYLAYAFYVKGVEVGKVSIIAPIGHSSVILTILLSVFFFKESLKFLQIIAMIIIIAGVLLVSVKYSEFKKTRKQHLVKGLAFGILAALGWGFVFFFWKVPLAIVSPFLVALYVEFFVFFFGLLSILTFKRKIFSPKIDKSVWFFAILVGVLVGTGTLFYTLGINLEFVSLVIPIASAAPAVTVISSMFILKERLEFNQIIAVGMIIAGLILISL